AARPPRAWKRGIRRRSAGALATAGGRARAHRQRDPPPGEIDLQDRDLDPLLHTDDLAGVSDKAVGQLTDVDEAVLVHANVDEGAEGGDVRDDARQPHAGPEVLERADALLELERLEALAGIAARPGQLGQDVFERRPADRVGHVAPRVDAPAQRRVAQ